MVRVLSTVTPIVNVLLPLWWRRIPLRRPSKGTYIYIAATMVLAATYVATMLDVSPGIYDIYGYVIAASVIILTILHLRDENPFSLPPQHPTPKETFENSDELVSPQSPIESISGWWNTCKTIRRIPTPITALLTWHRNYTPVRHCWPKLSNTADIPPFGNISAA